MSAKRPHQDTCPHKRWADTTPPNIAAAGRQHVTCASCGKTLSIPWAARVLISSKVGQKAQP